MPFLPDLYPHVVPSNHTLRLGEVIKVEGVIKKQE